MSVTTMLIIFVVSVLVAILGIGLMGYCIVSESADGLSFIVMLILGIILMLLGLSFAKYSWNLGIIKLVFGI